MRNKNAGRTLIDYDLNIFMQEVEDPRNGEWYYDPTSWMIHVYEVDATGHHEVAEARPLSIEEIRALGLNNDDYFDETDHWYGMAGYLQDYWTVMPDSIKRYLEEFPKYKD